MDSRVQLQSAVADLTQDQASELINDLLSRDTACSEPIRRLGDILRIERIVREEKEEITALEAAMSLDVDAHQDSLSRLNDLIESMKDHGDLHG